MSRRENRFLRTSMGLGYALVCGACEPIEVHFEYFDPASRSDVDRVGDSSVDAEVEPAACPQFPEACPGVTSKCTLLFLGLEEGYRSACLADDGDVATDGPCERSAPGHDDCAQGGFCSAVGLGLPDRGPFACRALCSSDAPCPEPQRCLRLPGGDFGVCLESCAIFSAACSGGARCAPGRDAAGRYFGYCATFGEGEEGSSCLDDTECGEGFACEQSNERCRALCDAEHPCPSDRRCVPLGLGDPTSPRLCVP
jgi:hypothetical protein